ncbi:hypothetical protein CQA53_04000 [Helicobacter didelphidarum]|uniref:G domain-containing protein n=1 Tax=Helicobacter didelphidarum TaxID=2040648 RepID=A0A3D8INA8_9HELI|nr:hypothetical protein [Helicobacter didelphidarum]RDU66386.1 hypothetical protein CQA53_04000 [Helicobacter didelphidarum]
MSFYDNVKKKIENVGDTLQQTNTQHSYQLSSDKSQKELNQAKENFNKFAKEADTTLDKLKEAQEWKTFTIAFYGETNAGKSTLIESLRLYLNEETKQKERKEFENALNKYNTNKHEIQTITKTINELESQLKDVETKKDNINQKKNEIQSKQQEIESQRIKNTESKNALQNEYNTLLTDKEQNKNAIANMQNTLRNLESKKQGLSTQQDLDKNLQDIENEILSLENSLRENNEKLESITSLLSKIDSEIVDDIKLMGIKEAQKESMGAIKSFFLRIFSPSTYRANVEKEKAIKLLVAREQALHTQKEIQNKMTKNTESKNTLQNQYNATLAQGTQDDDERANLQSSLQNLESKRQDLEKQDSALQQKQSELQTLLQELDNQMEITKQEQRQIQYDMQELEKHSHQIHDKIAQQQQKAQEFVKHNKVYLEEILKYQDGGIIGTGKSDFTRETKLYTFSNQKNTFQILDVPGIEGNEGEVKDEIDKATKKAHAVFYVKKDPTPPQKGDSDNKNKKGIIEKIKDNLHDQAEVYTIFNKPITSPHALGGNLISQEEEKTLEELDSKMKDVLNQHYKGHKSLSALVAFHALNNTGEVIDLETDMNVAGICIAKEDEELEKKKKLGKNTKKFLEKYDKEKLLELSQFESFATFLNNDIITNTKAKIKDAHCKKAESVIDHFIAELEGVIKILKKLLQEWNKEIEHTNHNLENHAQDFIDHIERMSVHIVDMFKEMVYEVVNDAIADDIDDDLFKMLFERTLEDCIDDFLKPQLTETIQDAQKDFESNVKEELQRLKNQMDHSLEHTLSMDIRDDFGGEIEINIDSGIEWGGLALGFGAMATVVALELVSGPVGWIALGVTALFTLGSSMRKFFDSDYKMAEQRKALSENLSKIIPKIQEDLESKLRENEEAIKEPIENIKQELESLLWGIHDNRESLKKVVQDLESMKQEIPYLIDSH